MHFDGALTIWSNLAQYLLSEQLVIRVNKLVYRWLCSPSDTKTRALLFLYGGGGRVGGGMPRDTQSTVDALHTHTHTHTHTERFAYTEQL